MPSTLLNGDIGGSWRPPRRFSYGKAPKGGTTFRKWRFARYTHYLHRLESRLRGARDSPVVAGTLIQTEHMGRKFGARHSFGTRFLLGSLG